MHMAIKKPGRRGPFDCKIQTTFKSIKKWKNRKENAAAYASEQLILQETFFKLKIRGL
jgi:hypothetical protein